MKQHDHIQEYLEALKSSPTLGDQVVHHEVLAALEPRYADTARPWPRPLKSLLDSQGIDHLFAHQARACDIVRIGRNAVVATPTASGKTYTYNLPVLEQVLSNPDAKALYLFPLKALGQDQLKTLEQLRERLPGLPDPFAAVYDGDTSPYRRKKLRETPPSILLTNPEMVHLSMLPHHGSWAAFWAGLTHVVVDEVHTYRGVLGSHMALVFRRLRRIAAYYGADPTFVFCSATVANPGELAEKLTGVESEVVDKSGAPMGKRNYVFMNPYGSPSTVAINLLKAALSRGMRTIIYTRSRRMTELISIWATEQSGEFKDKISAYRAGFLPEERREIETKMASGELLAVVSTSALELGIDIGALDLCILVGYPGTIMQTLQRGGRVGRKSQDSAVIMIAGEDALDQYFMKHPQEFFNRPPESAVLNPENPVILDRHLECAAAELSMRAGEDFLKEPFLQRGVDAMIAKGRLFQSADGAEYLTSRKRPHREVNLRGTGSTFTIEERGSGEVIGQVDENQAYTETHDGAVYLHRGRSYVVEHLDIAGKKAVVKPARVGYYTRVRTDKFTEILEIYGTKEVWGTRVHHGRLRVTQEISGYEKRSVRGGKLLSMIPLDLPPLVFETEGVWIEIPDAVRRKTEDELYHFMGGIHAVEHAAIGILPLLVMCDRNDLGGISIPFHHQVGTAAVFVYDGVAGGVGLSRLAFEKADEMLENTLSVITSCECDLGCPSCVHSPKCGSGNRPIAKDAAVVVLQGLRTNSDLPPNACVASPEVDEAPGSAAEEGAFDSTESGEEEMQKDASAIRFGVLDIETRRSAEEVGGWGRANKMGVSVAVLYDSETDSMTAYAEDEIPQMVDHLKKLDLVIGFNIVKFDYKVLQGVHKFVYNTLPTLDLLIEVHNTLGYRLKLDNLAQATLDAAKSADGLQALAWWKEGRLDLITEYCKQDVAVTRDLYLHGKEHGHVLFTNKAKKKVRLPVSW